MTLPEALSEAERLSLEWQELARLFMDKGLEFEEALSQVAALVVIERAKEE